MGDRPTIVEHRIYTVDTFYCLFFVTFLLIFKKKLSLQAQIASLTLLSTHYNVFSESSLNHQ